MLSCVDLNSGDCLINDNLGMCHIWVHASFLVTRVSVWPVVRCLLTPTLATCQPRRECAETIPLSSSIIHMSDEELGCPGNIARELLHSGQNFRGIYKSIKNDIFGLENNLYLHYSHKGVIVRVEETISKLQNWHTCKNFRGTLPCNLSKCAVFHTQYYYGNHLKMVFCVNNEGGDQMLLFGMFAKLPMQFLHEFFAKN